MSQNIGDLSRSSSASKAMRNMGINPGVQAKLMAFQAKRQQQIQQSKSHSSLESINNNNKNNSDCKLDTSNVSSYEEDEEDLMNSSPIDTKVLHPASNSPLTPLSYNSSTFSSPIISPNDERKPEDGLSRRTSFRLNGNHSNANSTSNDDIIRRTSFRLNKSNSITSSSTISDDSEDNTNYTLDNADNFNSAINTNITNTNSSSELNRKNSENSKSHPKVYPVNKNLSFISKFQKLQSQSSNSSSSESLSNTTQSSKPPSKPLPSLPTLPNLNNDSIRLQTTPNQLLSSPATSPTGLKGNPQIISSTSTPTSSSSTSENSSPNPFTRNGKLSLSQRRGMKLNLDSFNGNGPANPVANENTNYNNASPTSTKAGSIHRPVSPSDMHKLKNQINRLSMNSSPVMHNPPVIQSRTNMNKLREGSLPNRRKPMSLNLNGIDINLRPNSLKQNPQVPNNNHFTSFAKYVDIKSGSLNFAGKASLHSKGIEFSNGASFKISMEDLEILEELGHGNYGVVSKVLHKPTGIIMAMKEVRLELDDSKFRQILMELEVLHSCNSDCIVEFYGAFFVEGAVYMCMEYMKGGSLDKVYGDGIPEAPLAYITKRVIIGLKQLKDEQNIIHRDVKPTNMLVSESGKVKLCDFGVSGNLVASLARTNIGCQSYMAPERIKHTNHDVSTYSVQSDIWSLGLSILEISKGCYPYPPETYNNVFSQLSAIVDGEPPELPAGKFGHEAQDFVRQCLHKNPKKRPTYGELLLHPWLNMYDDLKGQQLLKQIVDMSLEKRKNGNSQTTKAVPALHSGLQV